MEKAICQHSVIEWLFFFTHPIFCKLIMTCLQTVYRGDSRQTKALPLRNAFLSKIHC